jgi:hypothetical protein
MNKFSFVDLGNMKSATSIDTVQQVAKRATQFLK